MQEAARNRKNTLLAIRNMPTRHSSKAPFQKQLNSCKNAMKCCKPERIVGPLGSMLMLYVSSKAAPRSSTAFCCCCNLCSRAGRPTSSRAQHSGGARRPEKAQAATSHCKKSHKPLQAKRREQTIEYNRYNRTNKDRNKEHMQLCGEAIRLSGPNLSFNISFVHGEPP